MRAKPSRRAVKLIEDTLAGRLCSIVSEDRDHYTILLLEDNPDDVLLMQRAFKKNNILNPVQVLGDGEEGIDYMQGIGKYADRHQFPVPSVVIVDLKMPRKSGLEFLEWVHRNEQHRVIPTILLSSSNHEMDVAKAYGFGANTYFLKPASFNELSDLVGAIHKYWSSAIKPTPRF